MPLSPSETRAVLEKLGHHPRRDLGQNFLVDGNIVRKSLDLAGAQTGDRVVEVGPGLGTLTAALLEAGAEVWAVEQDSRLFRHLQAGLAAVHPEKLHLLEGDAVEHPLAGLPPGRPFKIVANLPYSIATPWLDAVLSGPLPLGMTLMLQREAAERYVAAPGTKAYGAISIFLQLAYDARPGHRVAAACFHPRPDIESYLLNLAVKPEPVVLPPAGKALIRLCFQQRRKQIGGILRERAPGGAWDEALSRARVPPQARPEDIDPAAWRTLVQATADGPKSDLS